MIKIQNYTPLVLWRREKKNPWKSMKWLIISVFDVPSSHRGHQLWVNKPRQCHTICCTVFFISLHGLERWSYQSVEQNTAGAAETIHTAFLRSKFQLLTQQDDRRLCQPGIYKTRGNFAIIVTDTHRRRWNPGSSKIRVYTTFNMSEHSWPFNKHHFVQ